MTDIEKTEKTEKKQWEPNEDARECERLMVKLAEAGDKKTMAFITRRAVELRAFAKDLREKADPETETQSGNSDSE